MAVAISSMDCARLIGNRSGISVGGVVSWGTESGSIWGGLGFGFFGGGGVE